MTTPRLRWSLAIVSNVLFLNAGLAADWTVEPALLIKESYSDNLLASPVGKHKDDGFVSEVTPSVSVTAKGKRLDLTGKSSVQGLYYSRGSYRDLYHRQFDLKSDAVLVDEWLYLGLDGSLGQKQISTSSMITTDNLIPNNDGRGDVKSTDVRPRVYHEFGNDFLIDAEWSEERIRYNSNEVNDIKLEKTDVYVNSIEGQRRLAWGVGYNQSQYWSDYVVRSEQEEISGKLSYRVTSSVKAKIYGGKEEGGMTGNSTFQDGSYWSVGASWAPNPNLSLELAKGESDEQGSIFWRPTRRTLLNASYISRDVGVRPSTSISGMFSHYHKRTKFELSHTKEITNDSVQILVGTALLPDESGLLKPINLFGVTDEEFVRNYSSALFSYATRKNEIALQLTREQRDYSVTHRNGKTNGAVLGWTHNLSTRSHVVFEYVTDVLTDVARPRVEKKEFSLDFNKSVGRRTTLMSSLYRAVIDQNDITKDYDENRLSLSVKIVL